MVASASKKDSQVNPEFNEVRVRIKICQLVIIDTTSWCKLTHYNFILMYNFKTSPQFDDES